MHPLFIFSLPRAGSTLVQRVLAAHPDVASAAEPWILLPQLYALRHPGATAEYEHTWAVDALHDFCKLLPEGQAMYRREMSAFVRRMYEEAGGRGKRYFLDKTPRYHLIVDQIIDLFPDGRFIFLWRNPLAVAASMMQTWAKGRWNLFEYEIDLYQGVHNLIAASERYSDRVLTVRYEDLVTGGEQHWRRIFEYLGLDFTPALLAQFSSVAIGERMGDPTGNKAYAGLSTEPLEKWRRAFRNPLRRRWASRYLRRLGPQRLAAMGYDMQQLQRELASAPHGLEHLASDVVIRTSFLAYRFLLAPFPGSLLMKALTGRKRHPW